MLRLDEIGAELFDSIFEFFPYIRRSDGLYECPFCGETFDREWLETFGCCMHCPESLQYLTT